MTLAESHAKAGAIFPQPAEPEPDNATSFVRALVKSRGKGGLLRSIEIPRKYHHCELHRLCRKGIIKRLWAGQYQVVNPDAILTTASRLCRPNGYKRPRFARQNKPDTHIVRKALLLLGPKERLDVFKRFPPRFASSYLHKMVKRGAIVRVATGVYEVAYKDLL